MDGIDKLVAGKNPAGTARHVVENTEFGICEIDQSAIHQDFMTSRVNGQLAEIQDFVLAMRGFAQSVKDVTGTGDHDFGAKGFGDIVIGTQFKSGHDV